MASVLVKTGKKCVALGSDCYSSLDERDRVHKAKITECLLLAACYTTSCFTAMMAELEVPSLYSDSSKFNNLQGYQTIQHVPCSSKEKNY